VKVHFLFGIKSILTRIISEFNNRSGVLVVGYLAGNSSAGTFSFVSTFGQIFIVLSSSIMQNFNPFFASNYTKGNIFHIKHSIKKTF
jgi:O-antigen/teichoic acid export membrane protein